MKRYAFEDVVVLLDGVQITGFAEGDDVISVERSVDSAQHSVGSDGEMTVAFNADKSGSITLVLQQSSDSNAVLAGLLAVAEEGTYAPISAAISDTKGNDKIVGDKGYILRPSNMTRGTGVNTQEWTIVFEKLVMFSGGTPSV